jgi:hypothetical protein
MCSRIAFIIQSCCQNLESINLHVAQPFTHHCLPRMFVHECRNPTLEAIVTTPLQPITKHNRLQKHASSIFTSACKLKQLPAVHAAQSSDTHSTASPTTLRRPIPDLGCSKTAQIISESHLILPSHGHGCLCAWFQASQ